MYSKQFTFGFDVSEIMYIQIADIGSACYPVVVLFSPPTNKNNCRIFDIGSKIMKMYGFHNLIKTDIIFEKLHRLIWFRMKDTSDWVS